MDEATWRRIRFVLIAVYGGAYVWWFVERGIIIDRISVLLSVVLFTLGSDRFLDPTNISLIIQQVAVVGVLALGQTLIILTAGIDLSVGAIMVLSSIVMAKLSAEVGLPGPVALLAGFATGLACGLVNGFLVAKARIPPLIATLGTLGMALGASYLITGGTDVRGLPTRFASTIGFGLLFGVVPWLVVIAADALIE